MGRKLEKNDLAIKVAEKIDDIRYHIEQLMLVMEMNDLTQTREIKKADRIARKIDDLMYDASDPDF